MNAKSPYSDRPAIFVDVGTTNTRLWLASGKEILGRRQAQVGVRDTARDGSSKRLREALRTLIGELEGECSPSARPCCVIAAGMISSSLGLAEVPHVQAPAGLNELAGATRRLSFADVTALPIFLVAGVRTGAFSEGGDACDVDLMRGEETLCLGLLSQGLMAAPGVVLNLGSHWKAIEIDPQGQVAGSITTLSGEMVHAVQTTTILASAVPTDRPNSLDPHWVSAGMREQRRRGLPRALFCVRLLEQAASTSPAERLAFLIGAFIACDMGALLSAGKIAKHINMAIVGNAAIAQAWRFALGEEGIAAICIGEQQTETALLAGLQSILAMKNV